MKIWVVGRGYPTPENKMWGSFELEQAKLLARHGHDVTYIALTLSFFNHKDRRGMRVFKEDNVQVIACSQLYFPGKLGLYWEKFENKCWQRVFNQGEVNGLPDVVHIHYPTMISNINVVEKYRKRGVKLFVTEHWSRVLINTLLPHELSRLQYYAGNANCFASVSESLDRAVKELAVVTVPTTIIPNIVSPIFFNAPKKIESDIFTFVAIGRLVPLKQFNVVIDQFLKKFSGNDKIRLRIIGSGSERKKLESLCAGDERISFLGEVRLKTVADEIAEAQALISFSKYETFAVPVTEAWASGKPVIVSDKSGVARYATNELGIVVQSDSPIQLGEAMVQLYKNFLDYDSAQISAFAKEHFSDRAVIELLEKMYCTYD